MQITVAPRTQPVQQRSAVRIIHLLDAAAELIDERGIDGLTTNDVAVRSHSSVGIVYRYFPNIQSLLRALAARNMRRFSHRVFGATDVASGEWMDAVHRAIDEYVEMMRFEPGFRALRFGDVIDRRFIQPGKSGTTVLAESFATLYERKNGAAPSEELSLDIDVMVEVVDALLHRAFLYEERGDERFLTRLRSIAQEILAEHAVLSTR